jgi:hypothetical protein
MLTIRFDSEVDGGVVLLVVVLLLSESAKYDEVDGMP